MLTQSLPFPCISCTLLPNTHSFSVSLPCPSCSLSLSLFLVLLAHSISVSLPCPSCSRDLCLSSLSFLFTRSLSLLSLLLTWALSLFHVPLAHLIFASLPCPTCSLDLCLSSMSHLLTWSLPLFHVPLAHSISVSLSHVPLATNMQLQGTMQTQACLSHWLLSACEVKIINAVLIHPHRGTQLPTRVPMSFIKNRARVGCSGRKRRRNHVLTSRW